jgi:GAF domain-containing protein
MEEISITSADKEERYRELLPQINALVHGETNPIANMANVAAALFHSFPNFSWVGFYLYDTHSDELVLGPFQGKVACTRIGKGKGVCGTSFQRNETVIVPDVEQFPGHIYCDGGTKSEIVVPIMLQHTVIGVLDVDSYELGSFDETDKKYLEQLVNSISNKIVHTT